MATEIDALYSCGHGCVIAQKRGMGTNGGCHCLEGIDRAMRFHVQRALATYRLEVNRLNQRVERAERERDDARAALARLANYDAFAETFLGGYSTLEEIGIFRHGMSTVCSAASAEAERNSP